jgi:hypothetical protein
MKAKSWFALLPILLLGAYLRFHHLATFPSWYPDEGSNIAVAASLARGELAYRLIWLLVNPLSSTPIPTYSTFPWLDCSGWQGWIFCGRGSFPPVAVS